MRRHHLAALSLAAALSLVGILLLGADTAAQNGPEIKFDFGDAPDPGYPSLLANDGPRHQWGAVGFTLKLGTNITFENDSKQIDADEFDDGVVFLGSGNPGGPYALPYVPGSEGAVSVTVGTFPRENTGTVCAWFDWNQDSTWTIQERAFCAPLLEGTHQLAFDVPADALGGATWARFRVSTQDTLPTGWVEHGEVEDYEVEVRGLPVGGITDPLDTGRAVTLALATLGGLLLVGAAIVVWRRRTSSV